MENFFKCPRCGETNEKYIGILNGLPYCRKCIAFRGEEAKYEKLYPKKASPNLSYELSEDQKSLSKELLDNYKNSLNTLVYAVCGSGKTEISLQVISYAMECGERIGFAVPRRDVVIELYERFKNIFPKKKIVCVYGGHTEDIEGDLVCLTTHQLFRYRKYFDLLILDEIDAFPYKGNSVLKAFFKNSLRGHFVMMSATPSENVIQEFKEKGDRVVELFSRYHKHPLPVPEIIIRKSVFLYLELVKSLEKFISEGKVVFVFAPTIEICRETYSFLKFLVKKGDCIHSKRRDRSEIINAFKKGELKYLVTTAVLERGVTIKNLQVIVFSAENRIYDNYSLVQIAGRVGRKPDAPEGKVLFLAREETEEMKICISKICNANKKLEELKKNEKN